MISDDGHSPKTCNWRECKAESDYPCPFIQDPKPRGTAYPVSLDSKPPIQPKGVCQHEWRQYWKSGRGGEIRWPEGFYCVHCLKLNNTRP